MSHLLDTNVLSELRAGKRHASQRVIDWARQTPISRQFISVISLAEIEAGIIRLEQRVPAEGQALRRWFGGLEQLFRDRTLPMDIRVAHQYARLQARQPRPANDTWIAATALTHGLVVVTRNIRDFETMGVRLLNPWDGHAA